MGGRRKKKLMEPKMGRRREKTEIIKITEIFKKWKLHKKAVLLHKNPDNEKHTYSRRWKESPKNTKEWYEILDHNFRDFVRKIKVSKRYLRSTGKKTIVNMFKIIGREKKKAFQLLWGWQKVPGWITQHSFWLRLPWEDGK